MCSDCEILNIKHITIDINQKNLLIIDLTEDITPQAAEELTADLKKRLDDWIVQPEQPIFVLSLFDNIQVRLEKVENA